MKAIGVAIIVLIVLAVILICPWFTWLSLQALTNQDGTFTIGDWFAALWLMSIVGGAAASTK